MRRHLLYLAALISSCCLLYIIASRPKSSGQEKAFSTYTPRQASTAWVERKSAMTDDDPLILLHGADGGIQPLLKSTYYHARDNNEWQGMLVDLELQALCAEDDQCGLAMACKNGRCGPCEQSNECAFDEGCVLDHCVKSENIKCHNRYDCKNNELCVLSGYSADARGNRDMKSHCLSDTGGVWQANQIDDDEPDQRDLESIRKIDELIERARSMDLND